MIGRIKGKLVKKSNDKIFIDVNDICYEIQVSKGVSAKLDSSINENILKLVASFLQET